MACIHLRLAYFKSSMHSFTLLSINVARLVVAKLEIFPP